MGISIYDQSCTLFESLSLSAYIKQLTEANTMKMNGFYYESPFTSSWCVSFSVDFVFIMMPGSRKNSITLLFHQKCSHSIETNSQSTQLHYCTSPLLLAQIRMDKGATLLKKVSDFPIPSRDATNQTLHGREKFNYYLVSDIPAGDEKITNIFYSV
jgi:hypothetical protein